MSITHFGFGGFPERKKPEKLLEPPPLDFHADPEPSAADFADVGATPTATPADVDNGVNTIFTDIIPKSNDDLIPTIGPQGNV